MTEVSGLSLRGQRDQDVLELAKRIFVRIGTRTGNPLVRHTAAREDAEQSLRYASAFYDAADEWFATQHAAAAADEFGFGEACDARR